MRVQPVVLEDALTQLQATENDLKGAKEKLLAFGFGANGSPAGLYREMLGTPVSVQSIDTNKIPPVFHGSHSLVFKLPLWKDFEFVVNEHPDGQAWDPGFRRSKTDSFTPELCSATDLKPWKFVKTEITNRYGTPQRGDSWDYWEELYYSIPVTTDKSPQSYFLLFDYNLLQSFEITSQR